MCFQVLPGHMPNGHSTIRLFGGGAVCIAAGRLRWARWSMWWGVLSLRHMGQARCRLHRDGSQLRGWSGLCDFGFSQKPGGAGGGFGRFSLGWLAGARWRLRPQTCTHGPPCDGGLSSGGGVRPSPSLLRVLLLLPAVGPLGVHLLVVGWWWWCGGGVVWWWRADFAIAAAGCRGGSRAPAGRRLNSIAWLARRPHATSRVVLREQKRRRSGGWMGLGTA